MKPQKKCVPPSPFFSRSPPHRSGRPRDLAKRSTSTNSRRNTSTATTSRASSGAIGARSSRPAARTTRPPAKTRSRGPSPGVLYARAGGAPRGSGSLRGFGRASALKLAPPPATRYYKKPHKHCDYIKNHARTRYYCAKHKYMDASDVQVMDACQKTCNICGGMFDIVDEGDEEL